MNPQDFDHPDLTAYALGELAPDDAARVRAALSQSPEARAELARIEKTIGVLQEMPVPARQALHPRQRDTVLAMAQAPAPVAAQNRKPVPFLAFRRPAGASATRQHGSLAWQMVKLAAAACLTVGAFLLGQKTAGRISPVLTASNDQGPAAHRNETPAVVKTTAAPVKPAPAPAPTVVTVKPPAGRPQVDSPVVAKAPPAMPPPIEQAPKPAPAVKAAPPAPPATIAATPKPSAPPVAANSPSLKGFTPVSASAEAVLAVHPKLVRPLPVPHEFAGVILSSPLPLNAPAESAAQRKPEAQPALIIHSWKAEIASCPWDSSRRLMRFVAQIPVDQPGVESFDQDYKLVAKFDPFHVQGFRLVTEKHMRPSGGGTQATRFAWYEIIPTRNFAASADKPVTIGSIAIEQPRGTAPADATPLKLVDRGASWNDAREDFVFETAMIGWSLLLQGTENTAGLNHKVVLDIAEKTKGEDAGGERTKFINVVRQAQRAVGL